jgi:hypothetical protein
MLRILLSLRAVMLLASLGAALAAVLMFWLGFSKLLHGASAALAAETDAKGDHGRCDGRN